MNGSIYLRKKTPSIDSAKKGGGKTKARPVYYMKYRLWDVSKGTWGKYVYRSTGETVERNARKILEAAVEREEQKRLGLVQAVTEVELSEAVGAFIDVEQAYDREVPERNRAGVHPVTEAPVRGTAHWVRKLDFAEVTLRHFGRGPVGQLGAPNVLAEFDRFLARSGGRRGGPLAQSSRHKVLSWLKRFCDWCRGQGFLTEDPFVGFRIPSERVERRARVLSVDEVAAMKAESQTLRVEARARIGLVLATGARDGELNTLRVGDLVPERSEVTRVIWKAGRAEQSRRVTVEVPRAVMEDLVEHLKGRGLGPEDLVFAGPRSQAGVKFLRRWGTSMRGLRRTVLTQLHESGAPLRLVQEVAGHSKLDTTQRYLSVGPKAVQTALASLPWADSEAPKGEVG